MSVTRPALRYLGGKWKLAPWIISHFPHHRVYAEPFGGAASVLLRKPRSQGECYNDLDGSVVNLFTVLRDAGTCAELCRRITLTPFARAEYDTAFEVTDDPIEAARRLIVRSFMGHGSSSAVAERSTGFRASLVNRGGALPSGEWATMPASVARVGQRMTGVLIENRPALAIIDRYDLADALIYLDPPYVPETRSQKRKGGSLFHGYAHELDYEGHEELIERILEADAMIVLSGYDNDLYNARLAGWGRHEMETHTHGALGRREVLWVSPSAVEASGGLFA